MYCMVLFEGLVGKVASTWAAVGIFSTEKPYSEYTGFPSSFVTD